MNMQTTKCADGSVINYQSELTEAQRRVQLVCRNSMVAEVSQLEQPPKKDTFDSSRY